MRVQEILTPDLCVIGAGSGGLTVAAAAAQFGVPVVLIEKGRMGGDCLNYGCVPSKALLAAAKRAQAMRSANGFGIDPTEPKIDFRRVHDHVHDVIAAIAPNDSAERFTGLGVRVIQAEARFADRRTVEAGDVQVRARRFIIATGSRPAIPEIPGLDQIRYFTNESIFDSTERLQHLIVLGAGPVGLELAQAYRRLNCHVTVIEAETPLRHDDPEAVRLVLDRLKREGVVLETGATVTSVETALQGVGVNVVRDGEERIVRGSHLLIATGRKPNVEGLNLEAARIRYDTRGIRVNRRLRTRNRRVYAIGDVAGGPQFTHAASYHASLVVKNALFRLRPKMRVERIPSVIYTEPELAQIGLTEEAARKRYRYRKLRILRAPYADNDRAQAERETEGFIKVITRSNGRILGVTLVGAAAGELLGFWALAMAKRMKVGALTGLVLPYPTLSEIAKRPAFAYYLPALTKGALRSIIRFLRRFG
jgi:pyruvate/2-oxoglutarate dehydrogenase complex dihydrolipoamide dehydrogenase (E3) component